MKESTYRNMRMEAYCAEVRKLEEKFDGIKLHHVLRRDNKEADTLAKLASSQKDSSLGVFLDTPLIRLEEEPGVALESFPPAEAQPVVDHYLP
jgi:hypothetical protein